MTAEKISLTQEKETLLITLYCRAQDNLSADPVLGDAMAGEVISKIDYDFDRLEVPEGDLGPVIRTKQLDVWTRDFLCRTPDATVVHLGCGLDSRVFRIDPPASVRWYDVDHPEVIELRRGLYPARDSYEMIPSSATDQGWLAQIPADRPTLIVAEGMLIYLDQSAVRDLLTRLTSHFPRGEMVFDAFSTYNVRLVNKQDRAVKATGATIRWGIDDPAEIEGWIPGVRLAEESFLVAAPDVAKMPFKYRLLSRVMNLIPFMRKQIRLLRYHF